MIMCPTCGNTTEGCIIYRCSKCGRLVCHQCSRYRCIHCDEPTKWEDEVARIGNPNG